MTDLSQLKIDLPYIALFGSGNSILDIPDEEFEAIKAHTFVITLNYAPVRLKGHLNIWSDRKVSDYLENYYSKQPKDCQFLARKGRTSNEFKKKIDYWFDPKDEKLNGHFTIIWALQLLRKYFPEKKILLFGVDMYLIVIQMDMPNGMITLQNLTNNSAPQMQICQKT